MKRQVALAIAAFGLWGTGCSNDPGTSGPETMSVELDVRAFVFFEGASGATVQVLNLRQGDPSPNLSATTDTAGLAVFYSNINVLIPNHTYRLFVFRGDLNQATPEADTVMVPSAPNTSNGYVLETTVRLKPK